MEGDPMGVAVALPEDALAEILRRLLPRSLATSRCVCKAWRSTVDGRRLLLPELLPHSVRGIFLQYRGLDYPAFLSHPSMEPEDILGKLNFHRIPPDPDYQWSSASVRDHCNGLVLYQDMIGQSVANPATQWRARLPPAPEREGGFVQPHLAFDPTEALHYEVLLVPQTPLAEERDEPSKEWPATTWVLCVFSSRTGQWEERAFLREGEASGMASDEVLHRTSTWCHSCGAYWQGVLFVQCNGGFTVMRISLSNNKYRVIKMPSDIEESEYYNLHLGRSREGLCCASFRDWSNLRVWILDDSCGAMEWALKHHIHLDHSLSRVMTHCGENEGPWSLQDANNVEHYAQQNLQDVNKDEDDSSNTLVKSEFEWDSDNDNIVDTESEVVESYSEDMSVLGFHPYKEVIFLNLSLSRAVAYHLNTSKMQDLGKVCPDDYDVGLAGDITRSFLYTPCLIADFLENKLEAHVEG